MLSFKSFSNLSKSTARKRKSFWKNLGSYPFTKDDYDKAEKVPGDSKESTKKSKYTKKYKMLFGEQRVKKSITALKKKSEASGVPYSILKQVYNRGMAAWVTSHRPGVPQTAWAFARVNSFLTKGKTWYSTDADLAKKSRKYLAEEHIKLSATRRKLLNEEDDYEIEMISGQLKKIVDLSMKTLNIIQNKTELPAWIQDKVSVSTHNAEAIFDYYNYSEEEDIQESKNTIISEATYSNKNGKKKLSSYSSKTKKYIRLKQI